MRIPTLEQIENDILTGEAGLMTVDQFKESLWSFLCRDRRTVSMYAKRLNCNYGLGNVYEAFLKHFGI